MNDNELDAEFERIVAGWDAEAPDPRRRDVPSAPEEVGGPPDGDTAPASDDAPGGVEPPAASPSGGDLPSGEGRPSGDVAATGITLPIAPTTHHVWRGPTGPAGTDGPAAPADEDEGHFVPPTEPDLPSAEDDPMYWAIVVGLAGGPLLLLYLLIFDREGSGWWIVTAVAMTVVGFVLLVMRGGSDRDPFDDGTRL